MMGHLNPVGRGVERVAWKENKISAHTCHSATALNIRRGGNECILMAE